MRTFLIKNRYGREVHVPENMAVNMLNNPSVKIIGEVKTKVEEKEILVPVKNKSAQKMKRFVATAFEVIKGVMPGSTTNDISFSGNVIKKKSIIAKNKKEVKKSVVLDKE